MMLLETLSRLGAEFEKVWHSHQRPSGFAECAYKFLATAELPPFSWDEVERYALRNGNHSTFGDLNIFGYQNEYFVIEVLVWGSSSPDVHSHAFSGAFRVLEGGSVHASYGVDKIHWSEPQLVLGEVALRDLQILCAGDTHPIEPGLDFLHGLYHWHEPSVTIVLRTKKDHGHPHQFGFSNFGTSLQVLSTGREIINDRQLRAFRNLVALRPWPEIERILIEALDELPVWRLWAIYSEIGELLSSTARDAVLAALPAPLRNMPQTTMKRSILRDARPLLRTDSSRIAAGMLLFAPDRVELTNAVAKAFPEQDPIAWLGNAAGEMFHFLLSEDDEVGLSKWIVPDVLEGRSVEQTLESLGQRFTQDSIAEYEPLVRAQRKIVISELGRFAQSSPT